MYVCEISNHCIRHIDERTGLITTVAGSGKKGYDGDGGPATKAFCNQPYEVRFDADGNMFFVEMQNHLVPHVDTKTKTITTVAGMGEAGFSGDGGPATKAKFKSPHSIAFDAKGDLYIADIGNHRLRRVSMKQEYIDTVGGTGEKAKTPDGAPLAGTPLNGPRAIDFAANGDMLLALREGNSVYRVNARTNTVHHLAGTGKQGYA